MERFLEHRIQQLEESSKSSRDDMKEFKKEMHDELKEVNKRLNNQDTTIAKITLMIEGLQTSWVKIESNIQEVITTQSSVKSESKNEEKDDANMSLVVGAFKDITIEVLKSGGLIVGAIVGAKIFLG